jgi:hypothetical protein
MALDLLAGKFREPAECLIKVGTGQAEITSLYPFLMEVKVETDRHQPAVATLVFESRRDEKGKWLVQDAGVFKTFEPIRIEAVFGSATEEILSGYVREVRAAYPEDPGTTTVTVECRDASLALDREQRRKVWGAERPTDDKAILAEIVGRYPLKVNGKSGAGLSNLTLSQSSTDIRFLKSRAEANGYELIFDQGEVYFGPIRSGDHPQPTILAYAGPDTHCYSLSIHTDAHRPEQVAFAVAPTVGTKRVLQKVLPDLDPMGPETAAGGGSGLPEFTWWLERHGARSVDEHAARAKGRANEASFRVTAEGELDGSLYGHVLRPGKPVAVDGVGDWLAGIYYVDKVSHSFTLDGYRQAFTLLRNAYGDNVPAGGGGLSGVLARLF